MKTILVGFGIGILVLAGVVAAGCGHPASEAGGAAAAEPTAAWTAAFNAGDPAALAVLYAENARSLPPGGAPIVGRGAIEAYWREDLGEGGVATTLTPVDVLAEGDLLHVEGTYQVKGKDGGELAAGQYQQLWARGDDRWEVRREMWRIDPALHRDVAIAEELTSAWTAAYNAGDAKAVGALYAQDAAISSVQDGTFSGRMAIDGFWMRDLAGGKASSALTLTDVYMAGEMLHVEGDYTVTEGTTKTEGRYIQLWMRADEGWRIHREMWWR